ncbi:MAG: fused DSP-PTPase phosphatase/NAD kinase-like protein, partial [Candidatus Acidiferrales bacterium]
MKNFANSTASSILLLAAGMLFFGVASRPARAQQAASATTARADASADVPHKLSIPGVPNAGQATPELLRGAQPTEEGFANLAKMGVAIVVDLREGDQQSEREEVTRLGMKYVSIPWYCMRPNDN